MGPASVVSYAVVRTHEPPLAVEDDGAQALWIIIRPGYLIALFLACWAVNVHIFGRFHVDYAAALCLAKEEHTSPQRLFFSALLIGVMLGLLRFVALSRTPSLLTLAGILLSYLIALSALFSWLPPPLERCFRWRTPLARALRRCLCPNRSKEVPFVEVIVADGLTSLSRVFFDLALGSCVVVGSAEKLWSYSLVGPQPSTSHRQPSLLSDAEHLVAQASAAQGVQHLRLGDALEQCQQSSLPFIAWASPFLIRAQQCIVSARHAPDSLSRVLHRVNLLKYLSTLPIIGFALCYVRADGFQLALGKEDFEALWALAAVLNSAFSFVWDLVMDWGLMQPAPWRSGSFGLRPVLFYRGIWGFYHFAILCDLLGRTLWSLRWSPQATLLLGSCLLAGLQQAAEVLRRGLWSVLRVEWECIRRGIPRTDKHFHV
mmetsp:Transcript_47891/g.138541  ORF Transcript_47891/g.138541 Transcript_47891/m.138541 type:complete len:430 (+) Transcript_47891:140-1429(+)